MFRAREGGVILRRGGLQTVTAITLTVKVKYGNARRGLSDPLKRWSKYV